MKTVLIVEDDEAKAKTLGELLSKEGFRVLIAHDSRGALNYIRSEKIDFIASDLNLTLSEMDGLTLAKKIREQDKTTPFLLYTSSPTSDDFRKLAERIGIDKFIDNCTLDKLMEVAMQRLSRSSEENRFRHESL